MDKSMNPSARYVPDAARQHKEIKLRSINSSFDVIPTYCRRIPARRIGKLLKDFATIIFNARQIDQTFIGPFLTVFCRRNPPILLCK